MALRRGIGRRGGRALITAGVLATVTLASAGCGVFSASAPDTVTQTVTVAPPSNAGDTGTGGETSPSGAPVTVVAPSALQPSTATGSDAAADGTDGATTTSATGSDTGTSASTADTATASTTSTTTTTATTLDKEGRAVVRKLATRCSDVLTRGDITRVFGTSAISADSLRINEEGNPNNQMTARTKCYYGTSDLSVARPLVVALAGFETPEAAARQVEVTTDSEKAAGAKASQTQVGGQTVQLLLRDGGLAMVQSGALTISIAVADGIATDAKLTAALPSLTSAVLNHLG